MRTAESHEETGGCSRALYLEESAKAKITQGKSKYCQSIASTQ